MISDYDYLYNMRGLTEAVGANVENDSQPEAEAPELDPEHYKAYAKTPSDLDEETINQLVDIIDGKLNITPKPEYIVNDPAPETIDRLMNSDTIIYITEDDLPVGVATLVDPNEKSYQGFSPMAMMSMYSGMNLDGRVQQEFFAVAEEYHGKGIGRELRAQINKLGVHTFTLVDDTDKNSIDGMLNNGYTYVCTIPVDTSPVPVQLWID